MSLNHAKERIHLYNKSKPVQCIHLETLY